MNKRNVVIVGVLNSENSSNIWMASSFKRFNFDVIPINYRSLISTYGKKFFENVVIETVKKYSPYLTVFCKCNGVNSDIISECNKYSKTWLWMPDLYAITKKAPEIIEHAKRTNFSSCQSITTVDFFKSKGVKDCYHIFEGADQYIHKPAKPDEKFKADISFIGSKTFERDGYRLSLENAGYDTKFYYNIVPFDNWAKICSSSKFMLSMNTFNNIPYYFSGRVFEYACCGSCILHLDSTNTLNDYFKDGKEIIYFKDKEDLLYKIRNTDANSARRLALFARKRVLKEYLFDHSIEKIINIVEKGD